MTLNLGLLPAESPLPSYIQRATEESPERLVLGLPIEPAVAELDAIRFVLRRLAIALGESLAARGLAAERGRLPLTGVLYALGGFSAGLSLYVKDGVLSYEYNLFELQRTHIRAKEKLAPGKAKIEVETSYVEPKPAGALKIVGFLKIVFPTYRRFSRRGGGSCAGRWAAAIPPP